MAAWTLVPSLASLRAEFSALAPNRDKASDGSIGDAAHAASKSDHNPAPDGQVHAIDVDDDLRKAGWDMTRCVEIIRQRHQDGEDDRLQNIIWNRRITSRSWGWTWRAYTGASPHTEHAHFSARYTTAQESDTSPWGLIEENDVTKADFIAWLKDPAVREALAVGVWNTDQVVRAPGNPAPGTGPDGQPVNTHWAASSYLQNIYSASTSTRDLVAKLEQMDPAEVAAAIPADMARQVADLLAARLAA